MMTDNERNEIHDLISRTLTSHKNSIKVPEFMDNRIEHLARNRNSIQAATEKRFPLFALTSAMALTVMIISGLFIYQGTFLKENLKSQCMAFYSDLANAMETRDISKSVSFYDARAMGISEKALKENIQNFFNEYDSISYKVKTVRITAARDQAVGTSEYEITAKNRETGQDMKITGKDRIYFKKADNGVKIYCWIANI
jgi:hypothetical protein